MATSDTERLLNTIQGITREANRLKHDIQKFGVIGGGWQVETLRSLAYYVASAQQQVSLPTEVVS